MGLKVTFGEGVSSLQQAGKDRLMSLGFVKLTFFDLVLCTFGFRTFSTIWCS